MRFFEIVENEKLFWTILCVFFQNVRFPVNWNWKLEKRRKGQQKTPNVALLNIWSCVNDDEAGRATEF